MDIEKINKEKQNMSIYDTQHVTRYKIFYNGNEYIRLNEKSIYGTDTVSWLHIIDEIPYMIGDTETQVLEVQFMNQIS